MGTRTLARLQVTQSTFDEIAKKLKAVGYYDHVFLPDGNIAMDGIALEPEPRREDDQDDAID